MPNSQVENAIDAICNRGCRYVNSVLNDATSQQGCPELQALNDPDQRIVIAELSAVMSVYDQTGSCDA